MYTFREIWGNARMVEHLKTAAASGKVSHAYLFVGGAGAGKGMMANTFARALQCEAKGWATPCGTCRSCVAFNHNNHPDVIYVRGEKKNLLVEEIREQVLQTVDLKPYQYEKKIYIIEKADTMNIQAQNALLKTLEEPPAHVIFLLLAEREDAFLQTILSRVVTMKLRPISEADVAAYLVQKAHLSEEEARIYAAYAQGRVGQALELKEDEAFRSMRQSLLETLKALPSMLEAEAYLLAKEWEIYKNDLRFLDIIEVWYRDLLAARSLREERYLIQRDQKDAIFRGAAEPPEKLAKKVQAVQRARKRLEQNANFRLTLEVMLMDLKEK